MRAGVALVLLACSLAIPAALPAQSADARIRAQQEELDRIRRERSELEKRMANLQGDVHDLREEIENLDRQREATERVLLTLDRQIASISTVVDQTTERLAASHSAASPRGDLQARADAHGGGAPHGALIR